MHRLEDEFKVICTYSEGIEGLTEGKEYTVVGDSSGDPDPFICNWYMLNDNGKLHGYVPNRFEKI